MNVVPARNLTDSERELGVYVFGLIYDWKTWVHRRVEKVSFAGSVTYVRRTSIDFTIPHRPTPLATTQKDPLFCLPLALLQKQRLRGFNLVDESGQSLPLLTRQSNGAVACAVLLAAVRAATDFQGNIPDQLYDDLWGVANSAREVASENWECLAAGPLGYYSPSENKLRQRVAQDTDFLALAADLAANFLVLTILEAQFDQRRILKFEYEEHGETPAGAVSVRWRARRSAYDARARRRRHRRSTNASKLFGGVGSLVVRALVDDAPCEGVKVSVNPGAPDEQRTTTGRSGSATFALKPGSHTVVIGRPLGTVVVGGLASTVSIRLVTVATLEARYRRVEGAAQLLAPRANSRPLALRRRFARSVGWRARSLNGSGQSMRRRTLFQPEGIGH